MPSNEWITRDVYNGVLSLIGALFRLTAQDLKYGKEEIKHEAMEFLESEWFKELCECMEVDYVRVKKLIISGKVRQREEYQK